MSERPIEPLSPPRLTGGVGRTRNEPKSLPQRENRPLATRRCIDPEPGYATILARGWDSWEETFCLKPNLALEGALRRAQEKAKALDQEIPITITDEPMRVWRTGVKGYSHVAGGPDFLFMFALDREMNAVKVRYLSHALWTVGLRDLQDRAWVALDRACTPKDGPRCAVVRADYAVDLYCPDFTREFTPGLAGQMVSHSSVKRRTEGHFDLWSRGRGETLTVGSKHGLQVSVYDKGLEISEVKGTDWIKELWGREGYWPPDDKPRDVWRVECRFGKKYLKARGLREPGAVEKARSEMVAEALWTRRLTRPSPTDSNRRRWPMHPLWTAAWRAAGEADEMPPLGRVRTLRRDALVETFLAQIAGTARRAVVAANGNFSPAALTDFLEEARRSVMSDRGHLAKVSRAKSDYADLEVPQ